MPAEHDATTSIHKSFAPPPPIIKHPGPELAEPGPVPGSDWTTEPGQTASGIADGARGLRQVVSRETQAIRREAGMTAEDAARG